MFDRISQGIGLSLVLVTTLFSPFRHVAGQPSQGTIRAAHFALTYDRRGITGLWNPQDPFQANLVSDDGRLGEPVVTYRVEGGDWLPIYTGARRLEAEPEKGMLTYTDFDPGSPLKMVQQFTLADEILDWTIEIETTMNFPVQIGDLALPIPWRFPVGDARTIFERSWTKHHFIAGHGSFLYFVRPSGEPPYLVITVHPGTKFEYYTSEGRRNYRAYIHSGLSGGRETRGSWRQPHTVLTLQPAGAPGSAVRYGVRFQWAWSYAEMREILYREGLFDIRVVPGMTVPEDLTALIALRTKARIEALEPEFPDKTRITYLGERRPDHHLYRIAFARLGENLVTIRHDGGRRTYLEFFVTEPIETLIKKRSRFITRRQQHRDPSKWYNGLYSVYDMKNKILRSPEDTDGFDYWWGYVLASDDPVLGKAPFVAAKNVHFPDPEEIASVEYYIEHFVWGGLQRTDQEHPYPYGIYGVPNWKVNRDPDPRARAGIRNRHLDKMPIWRSFDYPHVIMLYFHMYEIARKYPQMVRYLDARGYLERAYQTARAYFLYPYEILPLEYETYKIGCYNEVVIPSLIAALEREGFLEKAAWLRGEWEKKVKYFIYDDPYPYRSEYPFDRTAFETTYAVAKYGATHEMKPDENLWFDKRLRKWYSHPVVRKEDALAFMERQRRANLAVRGWLEAAYYLLGADFTGSSDVGAMSYMAAMGGWAILDYAIHFARDPAEWLQLGYASILSSWSLMNTGRPETNYGFWFPGEENDGAAGWQFMTAKFGRAWIRKDMPRGAWHYDGEIDLGFGGALRAAATILTRDPLFEWFAYGGALAVSEGEFSILPRDGLRKRFHIVLPDFRMTIELDRDGFAAERPIVVAKDFGRIRLSVENRTSDAHVTQLRVSLRDTAIGVDSGQEPEVPRTTYAVVHDGRRVGTVRLGEESEIELRISGSTTIVELIREREGSRRN
ncbi:hypothetical protein HRbin08_01704 [bacterium HR08]|nr:hypothetical protein HRbin08_01704 [bacterium HR08]